MRHEDTADFSSEAEHHFGQNAEKAGKDETEQGAFVLPVSAVPQVWQEYTRIIRKTIRRKTSKNSQLPYELNIESWANGKRTLLPDGWAWAVSCQIRHVYA